MYPVSLYTYAFVFYFLLHTVCLAQRPPLLSTMPVPQTPRGYLRRGGADRAHARRQRTDLSFGRRSRLPVLANANARPRTLRRRGGANKARLSSAHEPFPFPSSFALATALSLPVRAVAPLLARHHHSLLLRCR
ncbi:hypothetical protein DFH06DRAFT_1219524 [Mycena polygramma]|nr:hypothetical protein DFH06DRAFT_1219524 [Mycena polygramma]